MRIAVLSDVHSNLPALEKILSHIKSIHVDRIYCTGDIVGYGPFPNECIELIKDHCHGVVLGNHDAGLIGKAELKAFNKPGRKALEWTMKKIKEKNLTYLSGLPLMIEQEDITFVHSNPSNPDKWNYVTSLGDAREAFQAFSTSFCFIGHTHIPSVISEDFSLHKVVRGKRFLINTGSVGQPRDGNPGAAFGIFDTEKWHYELKRIEYDVNTMINAIENSGLPKLLSRRLIHGV